MGDRKSWNAYVEKGKKPAKVHKVLSEFKKGTLHIGKSKKIVKKRRQAVAIAMSMSGQTKKKKRG